MTGKPAGKGDKVDVQKGAGGDDRLAMLKELAKLTKPTGPSAKGKSEEKLSDDS